MMNDIELLCQAIRSAAYDEALAASLGLNSTDLRCLEHAIAEPGLTPGRLADLSGLTTGAITGVLDRLERAGFVERRPDAVDRRSVTVYPSTGANAVRDGLAPLQRALEGLLKRQPAESRAGIIRFAAEASEIVTSEAARFRAATRGGFTGDTYSAPLADATQGRLVFVTGAPRIALNVAPLGPAAAARIIMETSASRLRFGGVAPAGELIRASFKGPLPDIRTAGGSVTVRYKRSTFAAFSSRRAEIALASAIPWTIELQGGLTDLDGTLDGLELARLDVGDGANHVDLSLPAPDGTVPIRILGVASAVRLTRPATVPVGLRVDGGISGLRLDRVRHRDVGGDQRFFTDGFKASPDRYAIEILAGASDVRIGTRAS